MAVTFISYTGKYPCLCSGILTVDIDGKEYRFGSKCGDDTLYPKFWSSGGSCGFDSSWNSYIEHNSWIESSFWRTYKDKDKDKEFFIESHLSELLSVMNANVPHGCCGGCL